MKRFTKLFSKFLAFSVILSVIWFPQIVKAADATVTFGSEAYAPGNGEQFRVGVYITGEIQVGTYYVEVEYDNARLEYIDGAEEEKDGVIVLKGTGLQREVKYMLNFRTNSGGDAYIRVKRALINVADRNNEEAFQVTLLDEAPITVSGADTVGTQSGSPQDPSVVDPEIPHLSPAIVLEGKKYFVVDASAYVPEECDWQYELTTASFLDQKATFLTNHERSVLFVYLIDEQQKFHLYAYNQDQKLLYPCYRYTEGDNVLYYTSPYACNRWPAALSADVISQQKVYYAMSPAGEAGFFRIDENGQFVAWDESEGQQFADDQLTKLILILLIALLAIILILLITFLNIREYQRRQRRKRRKQRLEEKARQAEWIDPQPAAVPERKERPVISVQDVTMRFKVATSNVSGIKEYLIQLVRKQMSHREFLALDHVSFNVYKGEVVGIIGTNGSGKSTILRIVSGALSPTSGKVEVDRRKVQLLTLGTGFDMELTAKENVYLNGAIIGYSEEFINRHYKDIVEFAELEGFMDEKVKNFSSGMVSRLGFAIATVGEVAEILILDEVLSVGDEFFRKKSLQKVKEMIHSGSTVLMVSHSMNTILENCSKVVWIEKGHLKMVGEPKEVCAAYRQMQAQKQ